MRLRHLLTACMAAAVALTAACSDPEAAPAPTVDVAKLDSGNFPTAPRDLAALQDPKYGPLREALRIGATIPLPLEIDGRFTFQRLTGPERRVIPGAPPPLWALESAEFAELTPGLLTGWTISGERRKQAFVGKQMVADVLRFTDAAAADTAGAKLAERQASKVPGDAVAIPGYPTARAKFSPDKKYLDVWMARDSLLLYAHVDDPVSDPILSDPLVEIAQHTFDATVEGLKKYSPTPADQFAALPVDVDQLLSRTLPPANVQTAKSDTRSFVMPAQAALHFDQRPATSKSAFDDAGVDMVAFSDARVYRAADADAAARLLAAFVAQIADETRPVDAPPGLSTARCFTAKNEKTSSFVPTCFVPYERFVARVTAGNPQELHQKAAAQYKLFAFR